MKHNYPTQQILKYIYRELPALEHLEAEYAIETNSEWRDSFDVLKSAIKALPRISFYPSRKIVDTIKEYSISPAV